MLRVILATLGVALIAFGLFGGKSLEQVYAGLNGMFEKHSADEQATENLAESTMPVPKQATTVTNSPVANEAVLIDPSSAETVLASNSLSGSSGQAAMDTASGAGVGVVTSDVIASVEERKLNVALVPAVSDDTPAGGGSNTVDDGAVQEVKASARNEELELALGTSGSSSLPKEADVTEIMQTTAGEKNVLALFVLKDLVNMRQGPSIEHPVVLRLTKGQELMEFKRDGKWVHVGAYGTAGKIGWVHERLVGKTGN